LLEVAAIYVKTSRYRDSNPRSLDTQASVLTTAPQRFVGENNELL